MQATCKVLAVPLLLVALAGPAQAEAVTPDSQRPTYLLRYKFQPGEAVRWNVLHRNRVRTTVSGTTQTAETVSKSVKVWRVTGCREDGTATFAYSVESVDMWQEFAGKPRVTYNSQRDKKAPPGFETVAQSVGRTLSVITMDNRGQILERHDRRPKAEPPEGQITVPLPEEPIPVGHTWSFSYDVEVPLEDGTIKRVKTLQRFTLKGVKTGVATIEITNQVLTPIHDPAVRALLIHRESTGAVRFDIDAGRTIEQRTDLDKRVVGFRGPASSLHHRNRFAEELVAADVETASRPQAAKTSQ
jgi:hypothetical protein